jgi:Domain of unknown function (DUF4190)
MSHPGDRPPAHGQQPYGVGGYGPPGYGLQDFPPPPFGRRPTNAMAIAALVCALVCAPVGLGLGIAARRQIKRTHEEGDGLALAAVIVGGIVTGLYVLVVVVLVIAWFGLVGALAP